MSIEGAKGVLLNISGGPDLTLAEVTEAAETIQAAVDPDANIFFGAVIHPRIQDEVRVTVIATGLSDAAAGPRRTARRATARPPQAPAALSAEPPPRHVEPSPRPSGSADRPRPLQPTKTIGTRPFMRRPRQVSPPCVTARASPRT